MDLTRLTATAAAAAIRDGAVSSEQLVRTLLTRIGEREPTVAAWAHIDAEYAVGQARALDAKQRSGTVLGPLHGVPVGIKDIIDTADLPTENGTTIFAGRRPTTDASVVMQLKAAGAIILGKTVTTELAFYGPGKTRNPHNIAHTPGGSSSGSAAAVADFHVPLALGTQTAGSIIRPASYCGVPGFKPTFGRVSRTGVIEQSAPLDTIGGYARSIEDLALLIDCMGGADARDGGMGPRPAQSLVDELGERSGGSPQLAFVRTAAWDQGDAEMKEAFAGLIERLGDAVDEVPLPPMFASTSGLQRAVQFRDIARNYGPLADEYPGRISAKLAEVIAEGRAVSDTEYSDALALRDLLYSALSPLFSSYDAILTPASAGAAPEGLTSTGSPAFNFLWTYLGVPAISLPLLEAGGLPLGVQLVGERDSDGALLATGRQLSRLVSR